MSDANKDNNNNEQIRKNNLKSIKKRHKIESKGLMTTREGFKIYNPFLMLDYSFRSAITPIRLRDSRKFYLFQAIYMILFGFFLDILPQLVLYGLLLLQYHLHIGFNFIEPISNLYSSPVAHALAYIINLAVGFVEVQVVVRRMVDTSASRLTINLLFWFLLILFFTTSTDYMTVFTTTLWFAIQFVILFIPTDTFDR